MNILAAEMRLARMENLSKVQLAAWEYFQMGLSIGHAKPASKEPYLWRRLTFSRIDPVFIPELFDHEANIFVVVGTVSRNLCVLDVDSAKEFERHEKEFQARNLKPWISSSARGGHFWWFSMEGEIENVAKSKFPGQEAELRGHNQYVLCWPSIHPTGVPYEWKYRNGNFPPKISSVELNWLPLQLSLKRRPKFKAREDSELSCLSRSTRNFIENGALNGMRNINLFSAACDLRGNNFSYDEVENWLTTAAMKCGLTTKEIYYSLRSAFSRDRTPARQHKKNFLKLMPDWLRAQQWTKSHHWQSMETFIER